MTPDHRNEIDRVHIHTVNEYILRSAAQSDTERADYLTVRADEERDLASNALDRAII